MLHNPVISSQLTFLSHHSTSKKQNIYKKNHGLPQLQASGGLWRLREVDTNHRDATWKVTGYHGWVRVECFTSKQSNMEPKHNVALKHNVPCFHVLFGSILCVKYEGKILRISQTSNRTSPHFPTDFSDITVSFLRSTLYYVPGLNKNLEETNVPVFYKDCSTSCLFGASWFVIACFPFCSSEISMMTSFGYFYCFAWPPKTSSTIPNSKEVQCEQAARRNPVL